MARFASLQDPEPVVDDRCVALFITANLDVEGLSPPRVAVPIRSDAEAEQPRLAPGS